jgi:hypothetical protein
MIVYLVTTGTYSDYQVRGIFSSMEKAKDFANIFEDYNDIEACEVDRTDICIDKEYPFCVKFCDNDEDVSFDEDDVKLCNQKAMYFFSGNSCSSYRNYYRIYLYAKDRESATKIAKERHMQFLALNMYKDHKYINFITKEEIK